MSRILVIDDEPVVRGLMVEILEAAGYEAVGAEDSGAALGLLDDPGLSLVVSDIMMPGLTGLELLDEVKARRPSLPVILVTGAGTQQNLTEALARGAQGLVVKPFSHAELVQAAARALDDASRAEVDLRERLLTPTLASALANAIEARDLGMEGHTERLAALATRLAEAMDLSPADVDVVRLGAILHDVGKIGIPDCVLMKDGSFTAEELAQMRTHPLIGDRLLEPLDLLASVRPIVRHHHERWDGTGYPDGLAGEEIPLTTRIVSLADAVEAMTGARTYRRPLPAAGVVAELQCGRGVQWDPELVELTLELIRSGELRFGPGGLTVSERVRTDGRREIFSVLLVEGEPAEARILAEVIEDAMPDVRVVHAPSHASAVELCRNATWSLVLLDHHLPDGGGLDLLERLRSSQPELPIVMLTPGSGGGELEAFRSGASDFVVRGTDHFVADLTGRVRKLLEVA